MDGAVEHTDYPEISVATKATLYLLSAFFACAALLVLWRLLQAVVIRPLLSAKPKQKKFAKPVAEHLQPRAVQRAASQAESGHTSGGEAPGQSIKQLLKQSKKQAASQSSQAADAGSHSLLYLNTLKGHGDLVTGLAWSPDGQALATACEDRTIRVFNLSGDLTNSNVNFRRKAVTRGLVDVAFGQSARQLVVLSKGSLDAASLAMYDPSSNFSTLWELDNAHGGGAALTVDGCTRGVFATCGQKTDFKVFSSQGKQLAALDSAGLTNHGISLSANGQFVAAATFTTDVKIHELLFDRAGAFQKTAKVMDLKGHSRQASAMAFSPDGWRAVTASQDHSLRIWNIAVRYMQQEDPKCLVNVQQQVPNGKSYELLAFGAHGVIAAALERTVHMIDSASGAVVSVIEDAHSPVAYLQWSLVPRRIDGGEAYILATAGDRRVRLWRSA